MLKRTMSSQIRTPPDLHILDSSDPQFPLDCFRMPVRCLTVYGALTVIRWLILEELLLIFDIPLSALPDECHDWLGSPIGRSRAPSVPFMSEVPLKVLHKVYETWREVPYVVELAPLRLLHPTVPVAMYAAGLNLKVEVAFRQAVKADDAAIPTYIWDDRIWKVSVFSTPQREFFGQKYGKSPLDALCEWLLRYWRIRVRRCFAKYLMETYDSWWNSPVSKHELSKDLHVGRDCIYRTTLADWCEWRGGSALFFWRWPKEA
jgi:hypothetical protein